MTSMSEPVDTSTAQRTDLSERLLRDRLVVTLPDRAMTSLVAAVEVMVQEGITCFSFPVGTLHALGQVQSLYAMRATFGVHDVDATSIERVLDVHPALVTLRRPDAAVVARCREADVPVVVPALTPTEVQAAWDLDASAVVVVPAEVMGASYPEALAPLTEGITLQARGGLGAYSARRWAEAGAVAVWLDDALLGDGVTGGSLGSLRERCQTFRQAVDVRG